MSIFDWSTTASSNGSADANINFAEGQAPSTLNDSARAVMARLAFWRDWFGSNMTQGGASNAYTITSGESLSAYVAGMRFCWRPNAASTGAVTLNLDGIGAKKVYLPDGTQAASGDLDANSMYDVVYDASLDTASGGWQIVGFPDANLTDGPYLTVANDLSDLNSASTARTNLGLGTSATVNTGTSGATVPLLNGANTWGAAQTFSNGLNIGGAFGAGSLAYTDVNWGMLHRPAVAGVQAAYGWQNSAGTELMRLTGAGVLSVSSNTVWHAGNDGAGSGLDADTLDGVQASAFAQLASANSFTAAQFVSASTASRLTVTNHSLPASSGSSQSGSPLRIAAGDTSLVIDYGLANTGSLVGGWIQATTSSDLSLSYELRLNPNGGLVSVGSGGLQAPVARSSESTGTLTSASANKTVQMTGNITIDGSVFATDDMIILYSRAGARTITQGTGMLMRLGGTSTTGTRTLAAYGNAVIYFVSATECVVSGGAVS